MDTVVDATRESARPGVSQIVNHIAAQGSLGQLMSSLVGSGIDEPTARDAIAYCRRDPVLSVLMQLASRLEARDWLFKTMLAVSDHASEPPPLARRSSIGREEFAATHYFANRPLVLEGVARQWPAFETWTNAYLKRRCGHIRVDVMNGRTRAPIYAQNTAAGLAVEMPFEEYIDRIERCSVSNDFYMVARNGFFAHAGSEVLLADLTPRPDFFERHNDGSKTYLWFGPAGTLTPLHFDTRNNVLFQVRGRKRLRLFSPLAAPLLYQQFAYYSDVDCDEPDLTKTPLFASARGYTVTLEAGDALFIPVGWWHHVRSLDVSISIAMTDFTFPNEYGAVAGIA